LEEALQGNPGGVIGALEKKLQRPPARLGCQGFRARELRMAKFLCSSLNGRKQERGI